MKGWLDYDDYAVFGLGKSGVAAANLLAGHGKRVVASDLRDATRLESQLALLDPRVTVVNGVNDPVNAQVVVASPGLPPGLDVFQDLGRRGVPIISEIELAFAVAKAPMIAITGTDGKTTTTELTGAIFEADGQIAVVAGNIGTPICEVIEAVPATGLVIAEVSSFQLWSTHWFCPVAAGFTNIDADHLDYHKTLAHYSESKRRLLMNMVTGKEWGVFNAEDPVLARWASEFGGKRVMYGHSPEACNPGQWGGCEIALWDDGRSLFARTPQEGLVRWIDDVEELQLKGAHNLLNMMCAAGLALSRAVPLSTIAAAVRQVAPLPHRLEYCGVVGGVRFYDDSKATNAHAALTGLESMESANQAASVVAIVGGVDKGLEVGELVSHLAIKARAVVLIGEISGRLKGELLRAGMDQACLEQASTMEDAVRRAFELAGAQGIVVLSPACSSFDMFESYAHRGRAFQAAVKALKSE